MVMFPNNGRRYRLLPDVPVDVTGASDSEDGQHHAHIVVDDPGVDEGQTAQKAQSGLRLF